MLHVMRRDLRFFIARLKRSVVPQRIGAPPPPRWTSRSASTPLATLVLLLLGISSVANAQLSRPIARDDHLARDADANKYLDREAKPDAHDDELAAIPRDVCPANLRLRWQTEVSSSVYATPVVTDLFDDGHKEIVVPSFVHYLEVLEGEDGARAGGAMAVVPREHRARVAARASLVLSRDDDPAADVRRRGAVLRPRGGEAGEDAARAAICG